VLVDWERDEAAGGCLLRPQLVRRLLLLKARAEWHAPSRELRLRATSRLVLALSPAHAQLVSRLGDLPELRVVLRFAGGSGDYLGGEEQYRVALPVRREGPVLLRLVVRVRPHSTK
jgi:hypothetical protein